MSSNVKANIATQSYHLFRASIRSNGCESEDAVVQGCWVVVVLQHSTKQLQQLAVVRFERLGVRLNHLVQQQEANLLGRKEHCYFSLLAI